MRAITRLLACTLACMFALALSACGGGDAPSRNGYDPTLLYGQWQPVAGGAGACTSFTQYGGSYYTSNSRITIDATTLSASFPVYNDAACISKAGLVVVNYSLITSAGSVPGKTNVIRMFTVSTGFVVSRDGNGSGVALTRPPVTGISAKTLAYVNGSNMWVGDLNSPADADGYPTALLPAPSFTR